MDTNPNTRKKNTELLNIQTSNAPLSPVSNNEIINYREIIFKYLKKWYWFVISIFLCLGIAYAYLKITNKEYKVQSTILLRKNTPGSGLLDMSSMLDIGMSGGSSKEVEDEIQVLTSKTIMRNVIVSLNVETEYYLKKGWRYEEAYPLIPIKLIVPESFNDTTKSQAVFLIKRSNDGYEVKFKWDKISKEYHLSNLTKSINTPIGEFSFIQILQLKNGDSYKIMSNSLQKLVEDYCKAIKVTSVNKKSNAINLATTSACPKKMEIVLDKLVNMYNQDAVIDKNMIATNTAEFIDDRLKLISTELHGVESNVENYKKSNNLIDITTEAGIYLKTAHEYDTKISELETQFSLINYIEIYVKDAKHQYDLLPANLGITDVSLLAIMQQYNEALLDRMKLMRNTNDKNPVISDLEQKLKELRSGIIVSIATIKDGMKIIKRDLSGRDTKFNSKINEVPTQERQFLEIKRQQEIKQKLYLFLMQKREENALSLASTIPSAKTLDKANTDIIPIAPKTLIILLLALMMGAFFPIIIIYIIGMLNDKITDKKELEKLIRVPFLGSIALNKTSDKIVVMEGKTTPIVEMFRLIRTNLQFMVAGKKSPVILVTSTIAGEGKSFTSINIALSLALLNKKVILIGLDIRKPMLGEYLHISKDKGISLYLSDPNYELKDIIIPSGFHPKLSVIPAGPIPPNPAELLINSRLDEMIEELKKEFDYIILDSAPIGLVSDTYLLNRLVDNTIYVARQNYTPREACLLINDVSMTERFNKVAVVLNGTNEGTGYGYGYGFKNNSSDQEDSSIKSRLLNLFNKK